MQVYIAGFTFIPLTVLLVFPMNYTRHKVEVVKFGILTQVHTFHEPLH